MRKKIASLILVAAMVMSFGSVTAFASDSAVLADGTYTAAAAFMNSSNPTNKSMCAAIFADTADITVDGENATISIYVANPVPYGSKTASEPGSLTSPNIKIGDTTYAGTVDVQDTSKTFHASSGIFTITEGDVLTCDTVTFTLPVSELDTAGTTSLMTSATITVISMPATMYLNLSDITAVPTEPTATETSTRNMTVTANVSNAPSYTVTLPADATLNCSESGPLSTERDNVKDYQIEVAVSHMGQGAYVTVTAPASGELTSGSDKLAFSNTLTGGDGITEDTIVKGAITITGEAVDAAANGNYAGTLNFTISYFAE